MRGQTTYPPHLSPGASSFVAPQGGGGECDKPIDLQK